MIFCGKGFKHIQGVQKFANERREVAKKLYLCTYAKYRRPAMVRVALASAF